MEYINKIESERELVVVEKIVAEYNGSELPTESADEEDEVDYHHHGFNQSSNLTVLSTRVFSGPLKSGSQFVSILGSGQIRIRKSDLKKRETVLNMVSILGDNTILVESGIRVSNRVIPILGSTETDNKLNRQAVGGPELIISGTALLGNISVKMLKD